MRRGSRDTLFFLFCLTIHAERMRAHADGSISKRGSLASRDLQLWQVLEIGEGRCAMWICYFSALLLERLCCWSGSLSIVAVPTVLVDFLSSALCCGRIGYLSASCLVLPRVKMRKMYIRSVVERYGLTR